MPHTFLTPLIAFLVLLRNLLVSNIICHYKEPGFLEVWTILDGGRQCSRPPDPKCHSPVDNCGRKQMVLLLTYPHTVKSSLTPGRSACAIQLITWAKHGVVTGRGLGKAPGVVTGGVVLVRHSVCVFNIHVESLYIQIHNVIYSDIYYV